MPMVKVWNDNKYAHKEKFKEATIEIPAGGFITMDKDEAHQFKGQYSPMPNKEDPNPERFYKMIRIETMKAEAPVTTLKCPACATEHVDQAALDKHTDEKHIEQIMDKDVADKRRTKRGVA